MSEDKARPTKLKFKGEKTKKKRKREHGDDGESSTRRHRKDEDDESAETWVLPEEANEIRGPTFIVHPSDISPISVTYDTTRGRIVLQPLDKEKTEDDQESPKLLDRVPTEVSQVWVVTRVAGSPTINFRTGVGEGKFLSCDKHGIVSADREARGPQEEWTPIVFPDGMVAFQNIYEKYLAIDEVAGGQLALRGDSEEVGYSERFWVKIQSKYKKEAHAEEKRKEGMSLDANLDEASVKYVVSPLSALCRSNSLFPM